MGQYDQNYRRVPNFNDANDILVDEEDEQDIDKKNSQSTKSIPDKAVASN